MNRRLISGFITATISVGLGSASLVAVWFGAVWYEEGGMWPRRPEVFVPSAVVVISFCAASAWISYAADGSRTVSTVGFATPFAIPAVVCLWGICDGVYRPFVFWTGVAFCAFLAAFAIHAIVFRIRPRRAKG